MNFLFATIDIIVIIVSVYCDAANNRLISVSEKDQKKWHNLKWTAMFSLWIFCSVVWFYFVGLTGITALIFCVFAVLMRYLWRFTYSR